MEKTLLGDSWVRRSWAEQIGCNSCYSLELLVLGKLGEGTVQADWWGTEGGMVGRNIWRGWVGNLEEDWQGIKKTRYCSKIVILQVVPNMGQGRMEDLLSSTLEKAEKERWILPFKKLIGCLLRLLFVVFFFLPFFISGYFVYETRWKTDWATREKHENGEAWELKHGRTEEARPFLSPSEKAMELAVQLEKQRVRQTDLENIKDENKEDR